MKEELAFVQTPHARDGALFDDFGGEFRIRLGIAAATGGAELQDRANRAERIVAMTDGRAELHHRLVVVAGFVVVEKRVGERG